MLFDIVEWCLFGDLVMWFFIFVEFSVFSLLLLVFVGV